MPHLVKPFRDTPYKVALQLLRDAHNNLVARAMEKIESSNVGQADWGAQFKRLDVQLDVPTVPELIDKTSEVLAEVINMAATIERLMDAIEWFADQPQYAAGKIKVCHPSTSHLENENDLIIGDRNDQPLAICEVCDVVSRKINNNKKETSSLKRLGYERDKPVPHDTIARFICCSLEFADTHISNSRQWPKHYSYGDIPMNDGSSTRMLHVLPGLQQVAIIP
jgi:hypothetical protein